MMATNDDVAWCLLPVMVILGVLSLTGVIGNSLVCFVFAKKFRQCSQNYLIIILAVFDLHSCIITIPYEIIDIRFYVYYVFDTDIICKVMKFINAFFNTGSILILLVIAVDRYRKVCKPLSKQLRLPTIRGIVFLVILVSTCYSWPSIFLYGIRSMNSTTIPGEMIRDCSTPTGLDPIFPTVYNGVLFMSFVVISIALIVLYSRILREVKSRHLRRRFVKPEKSSQNDTNAVSVFSEDDGSRIRGTDFLESAVLIRNESGLSTYGHRIKRRLSRVSLKTGKYVLSRETKSDDSSKQKGDNQNGLKNSLKSKSIPDGTVTNESKDANSKSRLFLVPPCNHDNRNSVRRSASDVTPSSRPVQSENSTQTTDGNVVKTGLGLRRSNSDSHPNVKKPPPSHPSIGVHLTGTTEFIVGQGAVAQTTRSASSQKRRRNRQQTTMVAFSVTTVFIVSFLPHLCLMITKALVYPAMDQTMTGPALVAYTIFVRSYFVNCMANPFIYGILNSQFRLEVKKLLKLFFCRCRQKG
ncbi:muscarinic acetylcholine receptor M3-like [Physella acuta]|uniref:muscarinic acetylcholine receptor M3-like n=1 Tax=Physella acuta TaxID=109671 RepID=UPI0027DCFBE9|nr:muscarinic acetylcholine receptor M3-like [Physella acuta]